MRVGFVSFLVCTLGACAAPMDPRVQAQLATTSDRSTICQSPCVVEWQRAQLWLATHSRWKIQTATDVVLTTFNPARADVSYGFTVTREPLPTNSAYRIAVQLVCFEPLFGCDPLPADVRRAFYHYLETGTDVWEGGLGSRAAIR